MLRGVNVNGVTVKAAPLSACLQQAGFTGVRSVLASGNVTFEAEDGVGAEDVRARVEQALREGFGYDARVVVLTPQRLAEVAAAYPFAREDEVRHPYVVFASDPDRLAKLFGRHVPNDVEQVELSGDVVYWGCPRGSSTDTPFAKLSSAARWKPVVTTRNLRTVEKLVTVAGAA
nr:DUF1697 domain-containing protein [Kineococcus aurantiacus]